MEAQRKALRLSLLATAAALAPPTLTFPARPADEKAVASPFIEAVEQMKRWVTKAEDLEEAEREEYVLTIAKFDLAQGHPGAALAALHARQKAAPSKRLADECIALYDALGWEHWAGHAAERCARDFPKETLPL